MALRRRSASERYRDGGASDRLVAATIAGAALALVVAAVVDFAGDDAGPALRAVGTAPAAERAEAGAPVAFHRLMPDAMSELGRLVRVDGTVAGVEPGAGFWVRDLRGNTVFVAASGPDGAPTVERGEVVRVVGRVGLVPRETARARRAPADSPAGAMLVRDVELAPVAGGVDRLARSDA